MIFQQVVKAPNARFATRGNYMPKYMFWANRRETSGVTNAVRNICAITETNLLRFQKNHANFSFYMGFFFDCKGGKK
jgi:hypothetical protein